MCICVFHSFKLIEGGGMGGIGETVFSNNDLSVQANSASNFLRE